MDNSFNESYTDYWQERVKQLSDGTKIADADITDLFLPFLSIKKSDCLLDMGCSYGRFFELLSKYSDNITGIDIEAAAIQRAAEFQYKALKTAPLEQMPFADESFDKAFCWATFDCTEQEIVLHETNRILKTGGLFLVTGKNIRYEEDDHVAFIAERNAKLKAFPNHFTDIAKLYDSISDFGFSLERGFAFRFRGDFGQAKAIPINAGNLQDPFYEYLLILKKEGMPGDQTTTICDVFSQTGRMKALKDNFINPLEYFKFHQDKHGV